MLASGALPSFGNRSSWGGDGTPADRDFLRDALGHGWHLDRPAFNAALLDAVEAAGVPVWRQTRITSLDTCRRHLEIGTASPGGARTLHASMLVDASGRAAVVARRQAVRRRAFDTQIAAVAILEGGRPPRAASRCNDIDRGGGVRLVVRGAPARPAAGGRLVYRSGSALAECGLAPGRLVEPSAGKRACPERGRVTRLRDAGADPRPGGRQLTADPIHGRRVDRRRRRGGGLRSALVAWDRERIGEWHVGRRGPSRQRSPGTARPVAAYAERLLADYARYLWDRHAYYADERRWPDSPFWARRRAGSHTPSE